MSPRRQYRPMNSPSCFARALAPLVLSLGVALPMLACGGETLMAGSSPATGGSGGNEDESDASAAGGVRGADDGTDAAVSADDAAATTDVGSAADNAGDSGAGDSGAPASDATTQPDGPPSGPGCQLPGALPIKGRRLLKPSQAEDFAFDKAGNLVGIDPPTRSLLATPYQGDPTTLLAHATQKHAFGTRLLPNDDVVVLDGNSVIAISPGGQKTTLAPELAGHPEGLAVDRQGRIYVATDTGDVVRIDGAGQSTVISSDPLSHAARAIVFGPDYDTLYLSGLDGEIRKVALSADGKAGPQQRFAVIPKNPDGSLLGGMTFDECGNLYVTQVNHQLWRVSPQAEAIKIVQDATLAPLAVRFGSGRGGWKETALYVAALGGMLELDLGFRGTRDPYLATP
jgi:hypothetical protein